MAALEEGRPNILGVAGKLFREGDAVRMMAKGKQPTRHPAKDYTDVRSMILEELTSLYLRLNGYFLIPNYLLHLTEEEGSFGLRGEADILAVRFPYQRERLSNGRIQVNDDTLILPKERGLTDCIYAEVKEGKVTFNSRSIGGEKGRENIARVLEMFGFFESGNGEKPSAEVLRRAGEVHSLIAARKWAEFPAFCDEEKQILFRFVVVASKGAQLSDVRRHITLQHVLSKVQERMVPGQSCSIYRVVEHPEQSCWKGLTGRIVRALDLAHRRGRKHVDVEEFIAHVSQLCFRGSY
jgi:hypothetical protein